MQAVRVRLEKIKDWSLRLVDQHSMGAGIVLVMTIALLLTTLSMWLYVQSGAAGLDLSRPGFGEVRDNVVVNDHELDFSAEGLLTIEIVDEYLKDYRHETQQSKRLGAFDSEPLSDKALQFKITDSTSGN